MEKPMCDEIKIARLEVRQDEHMRNFASHCADEDKNFDALFDQVRELNKALASIDKTLSNQKTVIGTTILLVGAIFSLIGLAVQYFGKAV
jgi:hypothetical protein